MKNIFSLPALLLGLFLQAQPALYNSGNVRIHGEGQIGFHTDLINDAAFDQNLGLAGFYGSSAIAVSGAFMPLFYDVEVFNEQGIVLLTGMGATNTTSFMEGNITTPRPQQDVFYNFLGQTDYIGETDLSKIDGYAAANDVNNFVFPIGDATQLRPLTLNSIGTNAFVKCAYYRENINNPLSFPQSFNTGQKPETVGEISTTEFWHLEASATSSIQVSWNPESNIGAITDNVSKLVPVGWSITGNAWVNLGATSVVGDLDQGFLISNTFSPSDYAVITFASEGEAKDMLTLDNYLVTPNGDGVNDYLFIEELQRSQDHMLRIFDRNGLKVYEEKNYTDGFVGYSNLDNLVFNRNAGLPNGLYFYIVDMKDLKLSYQGYLYLEW